MGTAAVSSKQGQVPVLLVRILWTDPGRGGVRATVLWIPLVLLSALLHGAAAHFPGDDPFQIDGTLLLGASAGAEIPFEFLGPVEGGDTLRFEWSINDGAGPAVTFGIQKGQRIFGSPQSIYQKTAFSDRGEIWLPESPPYNAEWFNFNQESVSLAFSMTVLPGLISPDVFLLLVGFGVVGVAAFVLWRIGVKFWTRQREIEEYIDRWREK